MENIHHTQNYMYMYTHARVHLQESLFFLEAVDGQSKTNQYCYTIKSTFTVPKVAISQSETVSAVLISCDIKSLT